MSANQKAKATDSGKALKRINKREISGTLLVEIAWEVMNQVGGIYTVIRSKTPTMTEKWGDHYCLIGPYVEHNVVAEFDPIDDPKDLFGKAVLEMRDQGFEVHYGHWLISGRPRVVLFNLESFNERLADIKYLLWQDHGISMPPDDYLLNGVAMFGEAVKIYLTILAKVAKGKKKLLAHFHEWMAASGLPGLRKTDAQLSTIFTTHATMLGRYLAMNDPAFYDHLPFLDWAKEAKHFNIEPSVSIERAAAHGAHVLTTVSEVTAHECKHLLGRKADVLLPNGINNERFEALHEFQNLHMEYKEEIHEFVMGHFFPSYTFDLDNTLYFFTSGRYEYLNKGYDLTLEALARLNWRLKYEKIDTTVVMFFITKRPYHTISPDVLASRAALQELRQTVDEIQKQVGNRLFFKAAASGQDHRLPALNELVDDYWKLRYRRTLQSMKTPKLPPVVTHNLQDDANDDILNYLRNSNLVNHEEDRVKIVYHPDFIAATNPLFGMEYPQFVRGCHMGVFPSYYEPWGYTPLECIASGVPAVTSDLAGFGDYVIKNMRDHNQNGIYVVRRHKRSFNESADQLANRLYQFIRLNRRERINLRNRVESCSIYFDWQYLIKYYDMAYKEALQTLKK